MSTSLLSVPTRTIPTDDNNIGLGPEKSNVAPVIDPAHELDAREEELIRNWIRLLAQINGVQGRETETWYSEPADGGVGSLRDVIGRMLCLPRELRWFSHCDTQSVMDDAVTAGTVTRYTTKPGGVINISGAAAGITDWGLASATADGPDTCEVTASCKPSIRETNDGRIWGVIITDDALTSGSLPTNYFSLTWDGSTGVNAWRVQAVVGASSSSTTFAGTLPPQTTDYQSLRLRLSYGSGKYTLQAQVNALSGGQWVRATASTTLAVAALAGPLRCGVYTIGMSGHFVDVDWINWRVRRPNGPEV